MAIDITRVGTTMQRKSQNCFVVNITEEIAKEMDAAESYLVGYLPANAFINGSFLWVNGAATAGDLDVGTTEGGDEILAGGTPDTLGRSGVFAGTSVTGTGVPVYVTVDGDTSDGDLFVVINYTEYVKHTGEYTPV